MTTEAHRPVALLAFAVLLLSGCGIAVSAEPEILLSLAEDVEEPEIFFAEHCDSFAIYGSVGDARCVTLRDNTRYFLQGYLVKPIVFAADGKAVFIDRTSEDGDHLVVSSRLVAKAHAITSLCIQPKSGDAFYVVHHPDSSVIRSGDRDVMRLPGHLRELILPPDGPGFAAIVSDHDSEQVWVGDRAWTPHRRIDWVEFNQSGQEVLALASTGQHLRLCMDDKPVRTLPLEVTAVRPSRDLRVVTWVLTRKDKAIIQTCATIDGDIKSWGEFDAVEDLRLLATGEPIALVDTGELTRLFVGGKCSHEYIRLRSLTVSRNGRSCAAIASVEEGERLVMPGHEGATYPSIARIAVSDDGSQTCVISRRLGADTESVFVNDKLIETFEESGIPYFQNDTLVLLGYRKHKILRLNPSR